MPVIPFYVLLATVIAGFLLLLDRRDERAQRERATLLQRALAPHAAAAEHHATVMPPTEQSGSLMPMSDEEIAQMQARQIPDEQTELQRYIAQIEAIENGTVQLEDGLIP